MHRPAITITPEQATDAFAPAQLQADVVVGPTHLDAGVRGPNFVAPSSWSISA